MGRSRNGNETVRPVHCKSVRYCKANNDNLFPETIFDTLLTSDLK